MPTNINRMHIPMNMETLLSILIALQFAAFGWRIDREISVGDKGLRTWFPVADFLNVASMLFVTASCIILPMIGLHCQKLINIALSLGFILITFHPINMAAHYRLFSRKGRTIYEGTETAYITDQEKITLLITALLMLTDMLLLLFPMHFAATV